MVCYQICLGTIFDGPADSGFISTREQCWLISTIGLEAVWYPPMDSEAVLYPPVDREAVWYPPVNTWTERLCDIHLWTVRLCDIDPWIEREAVWYPPVDSEALQYPPVVVGCCTAGRAGPGEDKWPLSSSSSRHTGLTGLHSAYISHTPRSVLTWYPDQSEFLWHHQAEGT